MDEQQILQILNLLHTMQEACIDLYKCAEASNAEHFFVLCRDMTVGLSSIQKFICDTDSEGNRKLKLACLSILDTVQRVRILYRTDLYYCLKKIEFELLPLLQQAYLTYYFFQYLASHPEHLPEYYAKEKNLLCGNAYIDEAIERGTYKYEVSIAVIAYNKLEYTRRCVESILANIPQGLRYELILVNHGSSDGTKEYFEEIQPHKQLDIAVNGGGVRALERIVEGEYLLGVSNDVVVMPHAIENMLACIRSDPQVAWVVPATSNVSNFQVIPAQYHSEEELIAFAQKNNKKDCFRWEQRIRLCDPIEIMRSRIFLATNDLCIEGYYHTMNPAYAESFPDDRVSLLLRRNGYKLMLAKDAYCHHFGSVTLKDEIRKRDEQKYYFEGRQEFYRAFHVDPWGLGFCYDSVFMNRVVGEHDGHIEVLGINCGLGSNSLKIKEQIKEYCHNTDVCLTNITNEKRFLEDLKGIGDNAQVMRQLKQFKQYIAGQKYDYIVWEETFHPQISDQVLLQYLDNILSPTGRMFVKKRESLSAFVSTEQGWTELGNNWFFLEKGVH